MMEVPRLTSSRMTLPSRPDLTRSPGVDGSGLVVGQSNPGRAVRRVGSSSGSGVVAAAAAKASYAIVSCVGWRSGQPLEVTSAGTAAPNAVVWRQDTTAAAEPRPSCPGLLRWALEALVLWSPDGRPGR